MHLQNISPVTVHDYYSSSLEKQTEADDCRPRDYPCRQLLLDGLLNLGDHPLRSHDFKRRLGLRDPGDNHLRSNDLM